MDKEKNNEKQSDSLRRAVAHGKGFFHVCRRDLHACLNPEAQQLFDVLGDTLRLVGKRPEQETVVVLQSDNGQRLETLLSTHALADHSAGQPEIFRHLLRLSLSDETTTGEPRPQQEPVPFAANDEQEKFLAYNILLSKGVAPQEAEKQVTQLFSTL